MDSSKKSLQLYTASEPQLYDELIKQVLELESIPYKSTAINDLNSLREDLKDLLAKQKNCCLLYLPCLVDTNSNTIVNGGEAIVLYLALQMANAKLMGQNRMEMVQLVELNQLVDGLFMIFKDYTAGVLDAPTMVTKGIQPRMSLLNQQLGSRTFFLEQVNILEIYASFMMELCLTVDSQCLKDFSNLQRMYQAVQEIPQIKAYKASSRYTKITDIKQKGFLAIDKGIDKL